MVDYYIDQAYLIALVEENPVLWDKTVPEYRDKNVTKAAWTAVCRTLAPDYDEMDDHEQLAFYKTVIKKWTNIRDAFHKSRRKDLSGPRSRKYIYTEQMQFMNKIYDLMETYDEDGMNDIITENNLSVKVEPEILLNVHEKPGRRKRSYQEHSEVSNSEESNTMVLETFSQNPHMCFFQGILPHLTKYNENEILEFQMGVLQLISRISEKKKKKS